MVLTYTMSPHASAMGSSCDMKCGCRAVRDADTCLHGIGKLHVLVTIVSISCTNLIQVCLDLQMWSAFVSPCEQLGIGLSHKASVSAAQHHAF